jgi:hypothetical protein
MWLDVDDDKYTTNGASSTADKDGVLVEWHEEGCGSTDDSASDARSWPLHDTWVALSIPTGWLCPRCGKVNSPDMKQCGCGPERLPNTIIGPSETK